MTKWVARILLMPFSLLYGLIVGARNFFYNTNVLKSSKFSVPVIGVGNLSMGGSGKTPHVEYLINLLSPYIHLGVLSRGYMRRTRGYMEVERGHKVDMSGDESLQYKLKYPHVVVSVAEQRATGIPLMMGDYPQLQTIILDDAFQHRSVTPALNILVTDYKDPYFKDFILPGGRLREWQSSAERADIIIVSKCPHDFSKEQSEEWIEKINPEDHQKVFFSTYDYGVPYYMYDASRKLQLDKNTDVITITGIAKPTYLEEYLEEKVNFVNPHSYEDHHVFKPHEVSLVNRALKELQSDKKVVITTEKDSTRLDKHREFLLKEKIPIYIIPIKVRFFNFGLTTFDETIKDFLLNYKS